jgi:outer membrane biogenesis lipoprotein LolB
MAGVNGLTVPTLIVLAAALLAGCSASAPGPAQTLTAQAQCEQQGGVWMSAAGACMRCGGGT